MCRRSSSAIAGPDKGDPNGHPVPLSPPPRDAAVGWFEDDGVVPVTPATRAAVRQAVRWLEDAGWHVEPFRPDGLEEARELWWDIFGRASRLLLEPLVAGREAEVHPNLVEFLDWTRRDPPLTAQRLLEVEIRRDLLKASLAEQMSRFPVLLCPVAPIPAFRHGEREWAVERTARGLPRCLALHRLVQPAAEPGGVRSSASLARGPAHRRPGRDATVGGAAGTRGCTDHRAVARRVGGAASAVRVERHPASDCVSGRRDRVSIAPPLRRSRTLAGHDRRLRPVHGARDSHAAGQADRDQRAEPQRLGAAAADPEQPGAARHDDARHGGSGGAVSVGILAADLRSPARRPVASDRAREDARAG